MNMDHCVGIRRQMNSEMYMFCQKLFGYERRVVKNPNNYSLWFEFLCFLQENEGARVKPDLIRRTFERAAAIIPQRTDRSSWWVYIDIWMCYAVYQQKRNTNLARLTFNGCLMLIPHTVDPLCRVWRIYAQFEQQARGLPAARAILDLAISQYLSHILYHGYILMEATFLQFENCRKVYWGLLQFEPSNCYNYIDFIMMEISLGQIERAQKVFALAFTRRDLDQPAMLQEAYARFSKGFEIMEVTRRNGSAQS